MPRANSDGEPLSPGQLQSGGHSQVPDFVAIGHLCCDLVDGRRILGGSASYSSLTARALGQSVGVVTSIAFDFPFQDTFKNKLITISGAPSSSTTVFRNTYHNGIREQFVGSIAAPIRAADVPSAWTTTPIVYVCPIADEVAQDVLSRFRDSIVGMGAQGWLREWNSDGRIKKKKWLDAENVASFADAVVYSELDSDEPYALAEHISRVAPIVIVTQSSRGADVFMGDERIHVPAFKVEEIDPTGAGDVFAAAFLIRYRECGNAVEAARFASCAASFVCEKEGTNGIPTIEQVLERKKKYDEMYG